MQLPYFYIEQYNPQESQFILNEENSRHIVQVLRMQVGEKLLLTDGKGNLITAEIVDAHKKHCTVKSLEKDFNSSPSPQLIIAISPLKNNSRFEWFLEKATEIGITSIVPIICTRTEKQRIRGERLQNILVSAMLQSRQTWLPVMTEPVDYKKYISGQSFTSIPQKFIAHCAEEDKQLLRPNSLPSIILIGPEGDFTPEEIDEAIKAGCSPVTLGNTRLRTETAGVVAATLLRLG